MDWGGECGVEVVGGSVNGGVDGRCRCRSNIKNFSATAPTAAPSYVCTVSRVSEQCVWACEDLRM